MTYRTVNLAKCGFTFYNLFHIEEKGDMYMLLILIQSIQDPVVRYRLTELYEKYYRWLVKKAKDYVIDDAVAEDMVHDVFMRLIQKDEKWRSTIFVEQRKLLQFLKFQKLWFLKTLSR